MQEEQPQRPSYNLYLHPYISNKQAKSITVMRLQTHSTIYHQSIQHKYVTNLVVVGSNFIQLYAVFQNQFILTLGSWPLYEDILQVHQWDKTIVLLSSQKIIGLIYEDCMLKNAFMLALNFLQLGYRQSINICCDKSGFYMLISSSRQLLLCISQKCIQRYKAKPMPHTKMSIIEQNVKWNRPEYQYISDIVKFQLFDFELSKIQNAHFCQQFMYFVGYPIAKGKEGPRKVLYELQLDKIFGENQKQNIVMEFMKLEYEIIVAYVIRRDNQCQFFLVKNNFMFVMRNLKGQFVLDSNPLKLPTSTSNTSSSLLNKPFPWTRKTSNPSLFPINIIHNNVLSIYERSPVSGLSVPLYFNKRTFQLPNNLQVEYCDIQDGILAYCNLYESGVVFLRSGQEKDKKMEKVVLREYFGSIIDFNIGQNILLIEKTHKNSCRLRQLRRSIAQSPKPFIMIPKKIALQKIPQIKVLHSLEELVSEYQLTHSEEQLKKVRTFLLYYIIVNNKADTNELYKLIDGPHYEKVIDGFMWWGLFWESKQWMLGLWNSNAQLSFYKMDLNTNQLTLLKKVQNVTLYSSSKFPNNPHPNPSSLPIYKIRSYLISINQLTLQLICYNWQKDTLTTIQLTKPSFLVSNQASILSNQTSNLKSGSIQMRINYKSITFKKKDKDYFFLQVLGVLQGVKLVIWEVSVDLGLEKISHWINNVGEGPAILLNSDINGITHNHEFRCISCPQYTLSDRISQSSVTSPKILRFHSYTYQTNSYLILITTSQQLLLYKKVYTTNTPSSTLVTTLPLLSSGNLSNSIGNVDTGFLYYRQPLQLNIVKKFKYNESVISMYDLGCGMLKVGNLVFYMGQFLEISEMIKACFKVEEGEVWGLMNDGKIRAILSDGKIVSHYLTTTVKTVLNQQLLGIQSTTQNYVIYSRNGFQVFDKQLNPTWSPSPSTPTLQPNQHILTACAYEHYLAISYYNYCLHDTTPSNPQFFTPSQNQIKSIKFKIRIYNTTTKKKLLQKQSSFDEPILHLKYLPPDRLLIVTSTNISIINTKTNQSLTQSNIKNKMYSKRNMLGSFCYYSQKVGVQPAYMMFGGLYGGISFWVGAWLEKDKLQEMWFQGFQDGVRELQIFHYGDSSQMLKAIVADTSQNLVILNLHPKQSQTIASIHLGTQVTCIKKRGQLPFISTTDGNIKLLLPIKLKDPQISYLDFQQQIAKIMPLLGGFNTRESRLLNQRYKQYKIVGNVDVVDGDMLKMFFSMSQILRYWVCDNCEIGNTETVKNQLLASI